MKFIKSFLAVVALSGGLAAVSTVHAEDTNPEGRIDQIDVKQRLMVVQGNYFRLDKKLVVHAPAHDQLAGAGDLTPGTKISMHISPTERGSVPVVDEVWIKVE